MMNNTEADLRPIDWVAVARAEADRRNRARKAARARQRGEALVRGAR